MSSRSGFEGIYRTAESPKRRREVAERLGWGMTEKQIARDLGLSRGAVAEIIRALHGEGAAPAPPSSGAA